MKIKEYSFKNTELPQIFYKIKMSYIYTFHMKKYQKFIYNEILDLNNSYIYSLTKNDEIVSYLFLFKVKNKFTLEFELPEYSYIIREVNTVNKFRKQGYCKKLMKWIYEHYKNKFIFLEVNETNIPALKCYSNLKLYTNSKLEFYYDKFHKENVNYINSLDETTRNHILKKYPHTLAKFILYSNQ